MLGLPLASRGREAIQFQAPALRALGGITRLSQALPTAMAAACGRAPAACALLLLLLLVVGAAATVEASQEDVSLGSPVTPAPAPSPASSIDCRSACAARCALSSWQKLCRRACESCRARCNCVPPGTAGNHDVCTCYAAITTHGGHPKCP